MDRLLLVLLLASASAAARPTDILSGRGVAVTEYGEFQLERAPARVESAPGMLGGVVRHSKGAAKLTRATQLICARIGETFGIRYMAEPSANDLPWTIDVVYDHPKLTTADGRSATTERWQARPLERDRRRAFWTFTQPYQIVPGAWTISIQRAGMVLVSVTFDVSVDCGTPVA